MSAEKTSSKGFKKKSTIFWFALSAGAIACYILYKQPHIAIWILLKNMIIYGSIITIAAQLTEMGLYKIMKMNRRISRKKRRDERRVKTMMHRKKLQKMHMRASSSGAAPDSKSANS